MRILKLTGHSKLHWQVGGAHKPARDVVVVMDFGTLSLHPLQTRDSRCSTKWHYHIHPPGGH